MGDVPQISAVLIVRDESAHLKACLEALNGVVDEVVVVDTGSTDDSVALAKASGAAVHAFEWCNDFAAARNFALAQATGEYALVVDADEYVDEPLEARDKLEAFIAAHDTQRVGTITVRSYTAAKTWVKDELERFFPRMAFHYVGAIHEQLHPLTGAKHTAATGLSVLHHGYAQAPDDPDHKAHRNIPILQHALANFPNDEYFWFQLGKARYSLEEYPAAVEALRRALDCMDFRDGGAVRGRLGPISREVLTDAVVSLAYALVNTEQIAEAAALLEEHERLNHDGVHWADFSHVLGYVHLMEGRLDAARACYEAALALGPEKEDVLGTGSFACHYHLGLLDEAEGQIEAAEHHYLQAIMLQRDYEPPIARLIDLVVEQGRTLPLQWWAASDHAVATALYQEKLESTVRALGAQAAQPLVQEAQRLAPELIAACRDRLKSMQDT